VGQRVSAGTPLMAVVPLDAVWIDANFKEVQLSDMRVGQPVTVTADIYGGDVTYHGHVAGLGAGTGSAFAVLPPQNASGNWIKIVQRVPVRIALDPEEVKAHPLRVGLSVSVDVSVRDTSGPLVAGLPAPSMRADTGDEAAAAVDAQVKRILSENGVEAR
jgi:membrane fusion protein (multidrug efflux system)